MANVRGAVPLMDSVSPQTGKQSRSKGQQKLSKLGGPGEAKGEERRLRRTVNVWVNGLAVVRRKHEAR